MIHDLELKQGRYEQLKRNAQRETKELSTSHDRLNFHMNMRNALENQSLQHPRNHGNSFHMII